MITIQAGMAILFIKMYLNFQNNIRFLVMLKAQPPAVLLLVYDVCLISCFIHGNRRIHEQGPCMQVREVGAVVPVRDVQGERAGSPGEVVCSH